MPTETQSYREEKKVPLSKRSNKAIAGELVITQRTVEAHVKQIFQKLGLTEDPEHHRRVLAVLTFLRS